MKAVLMKEYGSPDQLSIQEIEKPSAGPNEIIVEIHTTAVNDYDWSMIRGKPRILKLMFGMSRPKNPVPGMELAGIVESIGEAVTKFKEGDKVYGDTSDDVFGTYAEYIKLHEKSLTLMPDSMSFEEAVTVPHAAMLAYQAIHDYGKITKGKRLLINGGGGGVGMIGIQLAKLLDLQVTGVDSGAKLIKMKEIGYDNVLDYKKVDFAKMDEKYDMILDCKSTRGPFSVVRALKKGGHYVSIGGTIPALLKLALFGGITRMFTGRKVSVLALKPNKDLLKMNDLHEKGLIKYVVDGPYLLEDVHKAVKKFGAGEHTGKVVVKVRT